MFLGRWIGWALIGLSVMALGGDGLRWLETGNAQFAALGTFWYQFDPNSLMGLQVLIERYLPASIWDPGMTTLLHWPGAPVLLIFGLLIVLLFRKPAERQRARFGALS